MALPGVSIQIQNGGLGLAVQTDDALAGLLLQGPAASSLAVQTPKLLTSLEDAVALGIDAAYDSDNTVAVYKHIREFYAEAGSGARLWIMLVSQAVSMQDIVNTANSQYAKALLDAADGKIRMLGVTRSPAGGYTPTITEEVDEDMINAISLAHALAEEYTAAFKPFRVILEGREYTGNPGTLVDLKQQTKNRVQGILGDTVSGAGSAVALALGRYASIPVMRKPSRVKSGSLNITDAYIGTSPLRDLEGSIENIHDKGWMTLRRFANRAGFYFTSDPTATASTDDYNSFARGRVIDKAITIAYETYVNEIDDEVQIDPNTGQIETVQAKYYQNIIQNAISLGMEADGEISGVEVLIDVTQNVLATNKICIELRIVPVGYSSAIIVKLGFDNPAN